MPSTPNIASAFLDKSRADVVFELFFVFLRDDGSAVQDEQTFESAIEHIVEGACLPEAAKVHIRAVYDRTVEARPSLAESAIKLEKLFSDERQFLVTIFSVLLRLAVDDGIMSRRYRQRLNVVLGAFRLTPEEVGLVPETLQSHLECFVYASQFDSEDLPRSDSISEHYEVLGCTPYSSSEELRTSYRRLVKKYHPDRIPYSGSEYSAPKNIDPRRQFEKVQFAYETVMKAKKLRSSV